MRGERTRSDENQKPALSRRFARFPRSATGPFSHNPKVAGSNPAPATRRPWSDGSLTRASTVIRDASTGASTGRCR